METLTIERGLSTSRVHHESVPGAAASALVFVMLGAFGVVGLALTAHMLTLPVDRWGEGLLALVTAVPVLTLAFSIGLDAFRTRPYWTLTFIVFYVLVGYLACMIWVR